MLRKMTVKLVGRRPLVMHNARLSDPLDEAAKALKGITSKKSKSDEDHMEAARIEFLGGLYLNDDGRIIMPSDNLIAMVGDGAKKFKQGKMVQSSVEVNDDAVLSYPGPNDPNKLWEAGSHMLRVQKKVQRSRISRTRPIFRNWELQFDLIYDADEITDSETVTRWLTTAGRLVGLGDDRPKYGRFDVEVVSNVEVNIA